MSADVAAGFLADIIEHPDDDAPRLIFTDWLADHGEPERAEFIRVQVELARMGSAPHGAGPAVERFRHERDALRRRERELLNGNWQGLVPSVMVGKRAVREELTDCGDLLVMVLRRGFVEAVGLCCNDWLTHGPALVRAAPLREVRLSDKRPRASYHGHVFSWAGGGRDAPAFLPTDLFKRLGGGERAPLLYGRVWDYATKADALADLSRACLRYAGMCS